MSSRLKMKKVYPEAYKAMDALDGLVANSGIDQWHQEMIRIRASFINGCAYCVDSHTQDALKLGIDSRKIMLIPVWREAGSVFNNTEQTILLLTEEVSLIHRNGIRNEVYNKSIEVFGEQQTARLLMTIITINAWNRIGVGLNMEPSF